MLLALQNDGASGLCLRMFDRRIEQRLVGHDPARLDAAGGRHDQLGLAILDPGGKLGSGKAAKHHRMDGAKTRAGQHCHQASGTIGM
jgi:hypothetical protein